MISTLVSRLLACATALLILVTSGCGSSSHSKLAVLDPSGPELRATDGRLEIRGTFQRGLKMDVVPTRAIALTFKNVSAAPLRLFLPEGEAFRANISTIVLFSKGGSSVLIPEPQPHGYAISERDFFLLAPNEERTVSQPFTIDPMQPGAGNQTARIPGYEKDATVSIRWTYENGTDTWPGGARTLDGVTAPLFGGQRLKDLWTGKLIAIGRWTVPD